MIDWLEKLMTHEDKVFLKINKYSREHKSWNSYYVPYDYDWFDEDVSNVEFLVTDITEVQFLMERLLEHNHDLYIKLVIVDYKVTEISTDLEWSLTVSEDNIIVKIELITPKLQYIPNSVTSNINTYTNCYSLAESDVKNEYTGSCFDWIVSKFGDNQRFTKTVNLKYDVDTAPDAKWLAENLKINNQEELEIFWAENINKFLKAHHVEIEHDSLKNKQVELIVSFTNPVIQPWWTGVKMQRLTLEGEKQISDMLDKASK